MIGDQLVSILVTNNTFLFFNVYIHILAALLLSASVYPFLSPLLKERWNYFSVVFFPLLFASVFPDLMFIISTLVERRSLDGVFDILTHGGEVHSVFHFHLPIILVAPTTMMLVMLMNKKVKGSYFDHLPKWSFILICALSIFAALFHVYLDLVGF